MAVFGAAHVRRPFDLAGVPVDPFYDGEVAREGVSPPVLVSAGPSTSAGRSSRVVPSWGKPLTSVLQAKVCYHMRLALERSRKNPDQLLTQMFACLWKMTKKCLISHTGCFLRVRTRHRSQIRLIDPDGMRQRLLAVVGSCAERPRVARRSSGLNESPRGGCRRAGARSASRKLIRKR